MNPRDLQSKLRARDFVITAEILPPLSSDPEHLLQKVRPLAGLADAINITDGASARVHMSALAAAAILVRHGLEPILQLTCRDRNRIALQSDMIGAAALGVRNLLILTGDDPSAGDQPDAKPVFDLDSRRLVATAAGIRDNHQLPTGRRIAGHAEFFIGVADTPLDPPAGWRPVSLQHKLTAGAQFAQTQFCMDAGIVRRYVKRLAEEGITERLSVLIGMARPRQDRPYGSASTCPARSSPILWSSGWHEPATRGPREGGYASICFASLRKSPTCAVPT